MTKEGQLKPFILEQQSNPIINLTAQEKSIFQIFLKVLQQNKLSDSVVLRVAGGWVRDKLLGKLSNDIDIAINSISGKQFAALVVQYMTKIGQKTSKHYGVVQKNTEKSKHLQTTILKVRDQLIDCCQLRTEDYTQQSRIPQIREATPQQDAYRRDLTINSVFYNINEDKIQDFTKLGIPDLQEGKIRTPLQPKQTFLDDPLRILRTIHVAAKDAEVQQALYKKVSYQRIGKQLQLMLKGSNPAGCMRNFYQYNILNVIVKFPKSFQISNTDSLFQKSVIKSQVLGKYFNIMKFGKQHSSKSSGMIAQVLKNYLINQVNQDKGKTQVDKFNLFAGQLSQITFQSALLSPFRQFKHQEKKNKFISLPQYVSRNSLVNPNKLTQAIVLSCDGVTPLRIIVQNHISETKQFSRLQIGMWLRAVKSNWISALLIAIADQYNQAIFQSSVIQVQDKIEEDQESKFSAQSLIYKDIQEDILSHIETKYLQFISYTQEQKLLQVLEMKPIIDGKEIMQLYNCKQGKFMKNVIDYVQHWQIQNPKGSLDQIKEILLEKKEQLMK